MEKISDSETSESLTTYVTKSKKKRVLSTKKRDEHNM